MEEEKKATKTRADFSTDSEWWTYKITHPQEFEEKNKEDEDEEKKDKPYPLIIIQCLKCGYIIDENEAEPKPDEEIPYKDRIKCPKCKNKAKFKAIKDKDEKEKIIKEQKDKEEKEKEKKIKIEKANIKDDLKDLLEDLEQRLFNGEISQKRFVALFINLSIKIISRNAKEYNVDWIKYKNKLYSLCDSVLSQYNVEMEAEEILQGYDEQIEDDRLYLAQYKYYIEDDKFSIADYEMQERVKEYEMQENNIIRKEKERELEEKYQKRRIEFEEKANRRYQRRLERSIC